MATTSKWKGPKFRVPPPQQPDANTIVKKTAPPAPAVSWWLGLSPAEFSQQQPREVPRMQGSKFAAHTKLITDTGGARS